jgi:hypothetical protein
MPERVVPFGPRVALAIFLAALVCEFVDSSLGMGYGTTLTPLLLLGGFSVKQVVPCILVSEFLTGLSATLMHQKDGNIDLFRDKQARSTAVVISLLSFVGAVSAAVFSVNVPDSWLKGIIGGIIISAGLITLLTIGRPLRYRLGHIIGLSALAAFNKGLSGGGYGPLVTAGQVVSGLPSKKAVAITSLAESFTCLVGLGAYAVLHRSLDFGLAATLTFGAMLSVPMATLAVRRMPEKSMRAGVGAATIVLGALTLIKLLV